MCVCVYVCVCARAFVCMLSMNLKQTNELCKHSNFHPNRLPNVLDDEHRSLSFLVQTVTLHGGHCNSNKCNDVRQWYVSSYQFGKTLFCICSVAVSVAAQDGIASLGKAHRRSAPYSAVSPRLPSKQCQYLSGWTQIAIDLGGWNVNLFLSPLLFPLGDQCCDALACPCCESSSSLGAPLPCQAADQMWYLQCLPVYLPVHSHWLRRAQDSRSTEVFAAQMQASDKVFSGVVLVVCLLACLLACFCFKST